MKFFNVIVRMIIAGLILIIGAGATVGGNGYAQVRLWEGQGAHPIIFTNEALATYGKTYADLSEYFQEYLIGEDCIGVRVELAGDNLDSDAVVDYFDRVNGVLEESLSIGFTKKLVVRSVARSDVPSYGSFELPEELNEVLADERLGRRTGVVLRNEIVVKIVAGALERSAAVVFSDDAPVVLLGERIVRDARTNYMVHMLANVTGLAPIWGSGDPCGDDGMSDTPIHSGPNYDCREGHRSTCTPSWDLQNNMMDARDCDYAMTWTPGQRTYLAERLAVISDVACVSEPALEGRSVEERGSGGCPSGIAPNPVTTATGCTASLMWSGDEGESEVLSVAITRAGATVRTLSGLTVGPRAEAQRIDVDLCGLSAGMYTVMVTAGRTTCSQLLIIGESATESN